MSSQAAPFQPHPDPYHEKSVHSLSVGDSVHHRVSRLFTFRHTRSCRADRGSVDVRGRNHGRLSPPPSLGHCTRLAGRACHRNARTENSCRLSDRKSTRLNSSHVAISYAVFCLKKKKNTRRL